MSDDEYIDVNEIESHQRKEKIKSAAKKVGGTIGAAYRASKDKFSKFKAKVAEYNDKYKANKIENREKRLMLAKERARIAREDADYYRSLDNAKRQERQARNYISSRQSSSMDSFGFGSSGGSGSSIMGGFDIGVGSPKSKRSDMFSGMFGGGSSKGSDMFAGMFGSGSSRKAKRRHSKKSRRKKKR